MLHATDLSASRKVNQYKSPNSFETQVAPLEFSSRLLAALDKYLVSLESRPFRFYRQITGAFQYILGGGLFSRLQGQTQTVQVNSRIFIYKITAKSACIPTHSNKAVIYFHGGGFCSGGGLTYRGLCLQLSRLTKQTIYLVDYRLAPDYTAIEAQKDCLDAIKWIGRQNEIDSYTLAGDSAGAYLAMTCWQDLYAENSQFLPEHTCLYYPCFSARLDSFSWKRYGRGYILTRKLMKRFLASSFPDGNPLEHLDSRLWLAKSNSHAFSLYTAAYDPLADEGKQLAEKLVAAGHKVRHIFADNLPHGFLGYWQISGTAREVLRFSARELSESLF